MPKGYPNDGRQFRGEKNYGAKITDDIVREIRAIRSTLNGAKRVAKDHPASLHSLAQRFGLKRSQVCKIALGRAWSHL